jgi:ferrous iron transport protein A
MAEQRLAELTPGARARVKHLAAEPGTRLRLQEMGLLRGTEVQYVRAAPLGDPIEIRVRGYHLSLRLREAEAVLVEVDSSQQAGPGGPRDGRSPSHHP